MDNDIYRPDIASLKEQLAVAQLCIREFDRLFQSLTPGGSEFVDNPQRCIDWAIERLKQSHEQAVEATIERNKAQERIRELEAACAEMRGVLQDVEWVRDNEGDWLFCPSCEGTQDWHGRGHSPDCELVKALALEEEQPNG